MKKGMIVLVLLACVQLTYAQGNAASALKAVEAAQAAANNAKKATKSATWIKLAQALVNAYDLPTSNVLVGASQMENMLTLGNTKALAEEQVVVNGVPYLKQTYEDKNLYFGANGMLDMVEVTKPVVENALPKALEAYQKALAVDNGSKSKDIAQGIIAISEKFSQEAYTAFGFGNLKEAKAFFEQAVAAKAMKPVEQIDTFALYNTALVSHMMGDYAAAQPTFEQCLKIGYTAENGEVYSKLADCISHTDTTKAGAETARQYLEEGFKQFPDSQGILIGLINYYLSSGENTDKLFSLLDDAKRNEPNNPSLYYVEGNIHAQLGEEDKAVESYRKCTEVDPNYEYGYIGEGQLYYNKALDLQDKAANELDDNKYLEIVAEFEQVLKKCIEPFEKAFELTSDESVKSSIAEYLKNTYFRFRDQDEKYMAGFEKYNNLVNQ